MDVQIYVSKTVFNIATGRMYGDSHWAYVLRQPLGVLLCISRDCIATGRFCVCILTATVLRQPLGV